MKISKHRAKIKRERLQQKSQKLISATNFCKLEFPNPRRRVYNSVKEYKWPSLEELYTKLYLKPPTEELHDALQDCIVLEKCIIKLKKRGDFVIA